MKIGREKSRDNNRNPKLAFSFNNLQRGREGQEEKHVEEKMIKIVVNKNMTQRSRGEIWGKARQPEPDFKLIGVEFGNPPGNQVHDATDKNKGNRCFWKYFKLHLGLKWKNPDHFAPIFLLLISRFAKFVNRFNKCNNRSGLNYQAIKELYALRQPQRSLIWHDFRNFLTIASEVEKIKKVVW